jgi:hypothetical protein
MLRALGGAVALLLVAATSASAQDGRTPAGEESFNHLAGDQVYSVQENWSSFSGGEGNYFLFVFRDINRNGIYDIGDRPLPGVLVQLSKESGESTGSQTNMSGFASFPASVLKDTAVIRNPGTYRLEAVVPRGWSVTTGNAGQFLTFIARPGSIADMVVERMPSPVGLAQDLYVAGTIAGVEEGGLSSTEVHVTASSTAGLSVEIPLDRNGGYFAPLSPGEWRLTAGHVASGRSAERTISVENAPVHVSAIALGAGTPPASGGAAVLDFEDITGSTLAELPSGVGGLSWHNMVATNFIFYGGPGYMNTSMSGSFVAYSSGGHPVTIWSDAPFDFVGAYFGVAWPQAHGETLIARAWSGGKQVAEDRVLLSALGPVWFDAEYRRVDRVELSTEHYWHFVTDDVVVRVP